MALFKRVFVVDATVYRQFAHDPTGHSTIEPGRAHEPLDHDGG